MIRLLAGLALALALTHWGARRYWRYREQRDLRIRNARLAKFCIIPQKGTRSTFSHREDL
jgi:hypothetical protein